MREALYSPENIWAHNYDHYYFYGIPGLKAFQCLYHIESIVNMKPSLVVISVGGNDVSLHTKYPKKIIQKSANTFNNIMTLQRILVQLHIPVLVTSVLNRIVPNNILELNKGLGRALRQRYISLSSCVKKKNDFHSDGVHLTEMAYRHVFLEINTSVQGLQKEK